MIQGSADKRNWRVCRGNEYVAWSLRSDFSFNLNRSMCVLYNDWVKLPLFTTSSYEFVCTELCPFWTKSCIWVVELFLCVCACSPATENEFQSLSLSLSLHMALQVHGQTWLSWELAATFWAPVITALKRVSVLLCLQIGLFRIESGLIMFQFSVVRPCFISWIYFLNSLQQTALLFLWDNEGQLFPF